GRRNDYCPLSPPLRHFARDWYDFGQVLAVSELFLPGFFLCDHRNFTTLAGTKLGPVAPGAGLHRWLKFIPSYSRADVLDASARPFRRSIRWSCTWASNQAIAGRVARRPPVPAGRLAGAGHSPRESYAQ